MKALFADTFYWIALTDLNDSANERALALASERTDMPIVTTDEVLAEFLTFFATASERMRRKALINAQRILDDPAVQVPSKTTQLSNSLFQEISSSLRPQSARF